MSRLQQSLSESSCRVLNILTSLVLERGAFFSSTAQRKFDYCNFIRNNTYPTYTNKLLTLQKKAIRVITRSTPTCPSNRLFQRCGLLKLPECNLYNNACTMFKVVHRLNYGLCELIPLHSSSHHYETRKYIYYMGKTDH